MLQLKQNKPIAYSPTLAGARCAVSFLRNEHRNIEGIRFYYLLGQDPAGRDIYNIFFESSQTGSELQAFLYMVRLEARTAVKVHNHQIKQYWGIDEEAPQLKAVS